MPDFRRQLWLNILDDLGPEEGCILPAYLIAAYVLIFPVLGLRHLLDQAGGFDIFRMTWNVHGLRISDRMLLQLARAQGCIFRVTTTNGVATLERLFED
jgi:hypothetical protein